jgi:hypothetical protein
VVGCGGQLDGRFDGQQAILGKGTWLAAMGCSNRHSMGNGGHFDSVVGSLMGILLGGQAVMGTLARNTTLFFGQEQLNWEPLWKIEPVLHLCRGSFFPS